MALLMNLPEVIASGVHARVTVSQEALHYRADTGSFKKMVVRDLHQCIANEVTRHPELFEICELPEVRPMGIAYELQANMHAFSPQALHNLLLQVHQIGYREAPDAETAPLRERIAELETTLASIRRIVKRNT